MALKALAGCVGTPHVRTYQGPAGMTYGIGVKQGAADNAFLAVTGAGQQPLGLTRDNDLVGSGTMAIVKEGEAIGISGAALSADQDVMLDANGHLVPSTAQGDLLLGRTVTSCAAANDEVIVYVRPSTR